MRFGASWGTIVGNFSVPFEPYTISLDPVNGDLYVTGSQTSSLYLLSVTSGTILHTISVGTNPNAPVFTSNQKYMLVPNYSSANVSLINAATNTVVQSIGLGSAPNPSPATGALDPQTGVVFFSDDNVGQGTVSAIGQYNGTLLATINVGIEPVGMTYDGASGLLYASNFNSFGSSSISVISGTNYSVVQTVPLPYEGYATEFVDPATQDILTSTSTNNAVSVVSPNGTVLQTFGLGFGSTNNYVGFAYEPSLNLIYISSQRANVIYVLNATSYQVLGSISVGNQLDPAGLLYDSSTGYLYVSDIGSQNITVIKPSIPQYSVTFAESGLPSGQEWNASLDGVTVSSRTPFVTFSEVNGTYDYSTSSPGYVSNHTAGTVTVAGSPVRVNVSFSPFLFTVTFSEAGLPPGTSWSVTLNGALRSTGATSLQFSVPNGTYAYQVGDVAGWHETSLSYTGSILVRGSVPTLPTLLFHLVQYPVSIAEQGLPPGTSWNVTLDGTPQSTTTTTITFQEANGTYTFSVGAVGGYSASPSSGSVRVSGASANATITFTSNPSSPGISLETYLVIGVIVAVVVVAVVVLLLRKRK